MKNLIQKALRNVTVAEMQRDGYETDKIIQENTAKPKKPVEVKKRTGGRKRAEQYDLNSNYRRKKSKNT